MITGVALGTSRPGPRLDHEFTSAGSLPGPPVAGGSPVRGEGGRAGRASIALAGRDHGVVALVGLGGAGKTAIAASSWRAVPAGVPVAARGSLRLELLPGARRRLLPRGRPTATSPAGKVDPTPAKGAGLLHLLRDALMVGGPHLLVLDGLERVQRQESDQSGRLRADRGPAAPGPADPRGRGGRPDGRPGHQPVPADRPEPHARPRLPAPGHRGPRAFRRPWPCSAGTASGATTRRSAKLVELVRGSCPDARSPGRADRPVPGRRPWRAPEAPQLDVAPSKTARRSGSPACWMPTRRTCRRPSWRCSAALPAPAEHRARADRPAVPLHAGRSAPDGPRPRELRSERIPVPDGLPGGVLVRAGRIGPRAPSPRRSRKRRIAGPEDAFVQGVYSGHGRVLERHEMTIEDDVEELDPPLRQRGVRAHPTERVPFRGTISRALRAMDLLVQRATATIRCTAIQGAAGRPGAGVPRGTGLGQGLAGGLRRPDPGGRDAVNSPGRSGRCSSSPSSIGRCGWSASNAGSTSRSGRRAARWRRSTPEG